MNALKKHQQPEKSLIPSTGLSQERNEAVFHGFDNNAGKAVNERLLIDRESLMTHGLSAVMGFTVSLMFYLNGSVAVLNATAMVIMFFSGVLIGGFIAVRYFKIRFKNLNLWRK